MADLTFFEDPAVDRVLGIVMELAAEVWVLRERLRTVEQMLEAQGSISRAELDAFRPSSDERAARLRERDAFVARIMSPLTHEADSPAPVFEPA